MCVVSNVGDWAGQMLPQRYPWLEKQTTAGTQSWPFSGPTRAEFEALKRDVQEIKQLLVEAKHIDEATGQADCEMEEKLEILRRVAELVGVSLDDVLGEK